MARRCKLISPTNLLLEQPILSPVEECEYVLHGAKEFQRQMKDTFISGLMAGACLSLVAVTVALMVWTALTGKSF